MIRIGTGSTNTSASTSERLYLNCTQVDGIIVKAASGSNGDVAMVFNESSRLGNSNHAFYLTEAGVGYASFSSNSAKLYNTTTISRSNVVSIGDMSVSRDFSAGSVTTSSLLSQNDVTASSNLYTETVHTKYISLNTRRIMTFDQSSTAVTTTIDSDINVTGVLTLSKPLSLKDAVIDNVLFNSNVTLPSLSLVPGAGFNTLGIYYNSNQNLGCNLFNVAISGGSAVVVNPVGNVGINTGAPLASLDIVAASSNAYTTASFSNALRIRDKTLSSNIVVDNQCRLGIGMAKPLYKLHMFDSNIASLAPSPVIGINVSASALVPCAPVLAAFSNNIPIMQISGSGSITLASNAYVAGAVLTGSLVTSNIGSAAASGTINFQTSVLSNVESVSSCNLAIVAGTATNFYSDTLATSNLNLPNATLTSDTTTFDTPTTTLTGNNITLGPAVTDETALQKQPFDSRRVLIAVPDDVDGTVVALGVTGNPSGRNVIRIAANYPAFEMYSSANTSAYQKLVQGVDGNGYYVSYDTTDSADLTTQRQLQVSSYGVRICKSLQIPFADKTSSSGQLSKAGYVGINLTSPSDVLPSLPYYPLHVNGSVWVQSTETNGATATTTPCFYVNGANCRVGISTNNPQADLHVNGNVYVKTIETLLPVVTSSDMRLKENITPITDALSKVQQLTGYTFTRKNNTNSNININNRETGLLAQEVLSVLPEAVTTSVLASPNDYMGVAYGNMAGLFVEAIKAMSVRIDALQSEVDALKSRP